MDVPLPQSGAYERPDIADSRCHILIRPCRSQRGGGSRGKGNRHHSKSRSLQEAGGSWRTPSGVGRTELSARIAEAKQVDAVLDLVGNSVILDSLRILRRGGRACLAGWLGGLAPIADFYPLLQMPSGVCLTFFASVVFWTPH